MSETPRYSVLVVEASPGDVDVLIGRLTLLGAEAIEERDATTLSRGGSLGATLVASFADQPSAEAALVALEGEHPARIETLEGDAWRDAWKAHWKPTRITPRFVVVPTWEQYEPRPGDLVLKLDPGRAFGTGQHASTALAARALERRITASEAPPSLVADVGCGSGILAFVALSLGVPSVIACDTDPEAVEVTLENANDLGLLKGLDGRVGGVEVVPEAAPLVVANIEAAVLIPMAPALAARVLSGGALVLSGVLAEQREAVERAYVAAGLVPDGCEGEAGWVAPEFVRP